MSVFREKIGKRIKALREEKGMSQEKLAKRIKLNRISLSQLENGERKISVEEAMEIAKVFDIQVDTLLDLNKNIKIEFEKSIENPKKNNEEIRIRVSQKDLIKFKEILIYILTKIGSKYDINELVLYKILYFIDFNYYEKYEEQLIGATYIKNNNGPTPVEFQEIVEQMLDKDVIKVKDKNFQYPRQKYLPLREPNLTNLKAIELEVINDVIKKLSNMNITQIDEYLYNDIPWKTTEKGKIIDYEKVFYRSPLYSVRKNNKKII